MQRPPSWVPCAPQWTVKKTALTSHLWCRFAALASLLYVLRNYCGNKAPRSARRKEAHAPLSSSCTAIVAAWLKPLLFGRCRIHAPPPPPSPTPSTLNNICKRSQASHASHQGKERGQHSPSLPFSLSLSSFGCCGRCRLPRLHVEFAPFLPFIFICAHSGTDAPFCTLAPCPLLQCACHTCHNVTLAFCFAPPSFPSLF